MSYNSQAIFPKHTDNYQSVTCYHQVFESATLFRAVLLVLVNATKTCSLPVISQYFQFYIFLVGA